MPTLGMGFGPFYIGCTISNGRMFVDSDERVLSPYMTNLRYQLCTCIQGLKKTLAGNLRLQESATRVF